jgi:hypothetical protein
VTTHTYTVRYHYATYTGTRQVKAPDADCAIAMVRSWVRRRGFLPMAYESYRVVEVAQQ